MILFRALKTVSKKIRVLKEDKQKFTLLNFMTNLDRIFRSRDITLPTKVHLVKAMVFPVVLYELDCEVG